MKSEQNSNSIPMLEIVVPPPAHVVEISPGRVEPTCRVKTPVLESKTRRASSNQRSQEKPNPKTDWQLKTA